MWSMGKGGDAKSEYLLSWPDANMSLLLFDLILI